MGQVVGVQLLDVVSDVRGFPSWYSWKRVTTRCCGPASPEPRNPLPASNQEYLSGNPLSDVNPSGTHHLHPCTIRIVQAGHDLDIGGATSPHHEIVDSHTCLLYTSPSPRDGLLSR